MAWNFLFDRKRWADSLDDDEAAEATEFGALVAPPDGPAAVENEVLVLIGPDGEGSEA